MGRGGGFCMPMYRTQIWFEDELKDNILFYLMLRDSASNEGHVHKGAKQPACGQ